MKLRSYSFYNPKITIYILFYLNIVNNTKDFAKKRYNTPYVCNVI